MERSQRPLYALALRLCAVIASSTVYMLVKFSGESGISVPEIMFWRQAACLPVIILWLTATGRLREIRTKRAGTHAVRTMISTITMGLIFTATVLLPLAVSTTLGFTSPLFAVLLAAWSFKQNIGAWQWFAVILGFAGIVIIAQPDGEPVSSAGVALMLLAALLIALINFQVRDLARTESVAGIVFWLSLFGTLLTAPLMPFYMHTYSPFQWTFVIALGVLGAVGQLLLTASLRYGAVTSVIVMDYSQLIWATFYGWFVWDKLPSSTLYLGAPLIVAAGTVIAWREKREAGKHSAEARLSIDAA
jgi:drug/metabolite transporter (DMT)-like permease